MEHRVFSAPQMEFDVHLLAEWLTEIHKQLQGQTLYYTANWDSEYEEEAVVITTEPVTEEQVAAIHREVLDEVYAESDEEEDDA